MNIKNNIQKGFLYLKRNGINTVGGIDYSETLLSGIADLGDDFCYGEAKNVSVTPHYDVVMAESVFEYFDSLKV